MSQLELKNTLVNTIEAIKSGKKNSKVTFTADTTLVKNVLCKAKIRNFAFNIDEPKELGGTDSAPNPVEFILAALGACQEILYGAYSAVLGVNIDGVSVKVKGTLDLKGLFSLDPGIEAGFQEISYETTIVSDENESKVKSLAAVVEKNCPVLDTLVRSIPITSEVRIEKKQNAA